MLDYLRGVDEPGHQTPEEAALGDNDIPERYVTIVGRRVSGEQARVWLLTNDREPFEEYECVCVREGGLWRETIGWGGFSDGTHREIRNRAAEIRAASR
jgi:hypothetical protein